MHCKVTIKVDGESFKPFQRAKELKLKETGASDVTACRTCNRQFRSIAAPLKKSKAATAFKNREYIANRIKENKYIAFSSCNLASASRTATAESRKCFLHGKAPSVQTCTSPTAYLSRPLRLCKKNQSDSWKLEKWINLFSDAVGVGTDISEKDR